MPRFRIADWERGWIGIHNSQSAIDKVTQTVKYRPYILWSLRTGAALLVVLFVAGTLSVLLAAMGDGGGAEGVKGVALVALVCWILDFVMLVVLMALAQLDALQELDEEEDE